MAWTWASRPDGCSIALGLVIGIAVLYPVFGGRLMLLDWVHGPHSAIISPNFWGLNGGVNGGLWLNILDSAVIHVLGPPGTWLIPLVIFPVATYSIGQLVGGPLLRRTLAGLLFVVNPFVFDRLFAGQVPYLIGYALLPLVVRSIMRAAGGGSAWTTAIWAAAIIAISPHYAWILAVVAVCAVVSHRARVATVTRLALAGLAAMAMSLWLIVPRIVVGAPPRYLAGQLDSYRTQGDRIVGLYVNVAGLYGFWRPGPTEPKDLVAGWPAFLLAIVVVSGLGLWTALRSEATRRLALVLVGSAVVGYFLALGGQGPTASIYHFAIDHVPGFVLMREADKFQCLVALFYAVAFAWGAERLVELVQGGRWRTVTWVVALALPFAYTPNFFGGFGGQVGTTTYPSGYYAAERLMAKRGGTGIMFPWHSYATIPFAQGRVLADPSPSFFSVPMLASDDPGGDYGFSNLTAEDSFVNYLVDHGFETRYAGVLLAALGVHWVVLGIYADWQDYGWLGRQKDLKLVLNTPSVQVWQNLAPVIGVAHAAALTPVGSLSQLLTHAGQFADRIAFVRPGLHHPSGAKLPLRSAAAVAGGAKADSPVSWSIAKSVHGWVRLSSAYSSGWTLDKGQVARLAEGNLAAARISGHASVTYSPWRPIKFSYVFSALFVIAAALVAVVDVRRLRRKKPRGAHSAPQPPLL